MAADSYYIYETRTQIDKNSIIFRGLQYNNKWYVVKVWKKTPCFDIDCQKLADKSQIIYQGEPIETKGGLVVEEEIMQHFFGMVGIKYKL